MSTLLITTQILENYGTTENPKWKFKGSNEYKFRNVPLNISCENYNKLILSSKIQENGEYYKEVINDCTFVANDYLTSFEKSQLEYDGSIMYPATEFFYEDLISDLVTDC